MSNEEEFNKIDSSGKEVVESDIKSSDYFEGGRYEDQVHTVLVSGTPVQSMVAQTRIGLICVRPAMQSDHSWRLEVTYQQKVSNRLLKRELRSDVVRRQLEVLGDALVYEGFLPEELRGLFQNYRDSCWACIAFNKRLRRRKGKPDALDRRIRVVLDNDQIQADSMIRQVIVSTNEVKVSSLWDIITTALY